MWFWQNDECAVMIFMGIRPFGLSGLVFFFLCLAIDCVCVCVCVCVRVCVCVCVRQTDRQTDRQS